VPGTVREGEDDMGFLDTLRDKLTGSNDDYYDDDYYDDYDDAPEREEPQSQGAGLLGNTRRPEAESVSVYTRSGRPVGSNGAGGPTPAPAPSYGSGYRDEYQRPARPQSPNPQYAQRPQSGYGSYSDETQAIPQTPAHPPVHEGVLGNSTGGHTPADIGLKPIPRPATSGQLPPYVLKPVSYDDVQMVVRRVRTNQPVILIFKGTNIETAKRLLDFCYGLSYGVAGSVEALGDRVFAVLPAGIELTQGDIDKLVADGDLEA